MIWLLLGCGEPAELPRGAGAEVCDAEPFEQLRTVCLVEASARAGREGDAARIVEACGGVPEGAWREECHFRGGEELGRAGRVEDALAHCAQAGRYARFCVTHTAWGLPTDTAGALESWVAAAAPLPDDLRPEAEELLRARWWFNRYFGTGAADPALADDTPFARSAWALEAVRLADGDLAAARAAWTSRTALAGPPLDPARRIGRYDLPFDIPGEAALPRVATFGGSKRFVGETIEEDVDIALLEALYFREATTDGAAFTAYLADPRPRVRYTAVRLFRVLPSADVEATLQGLAADPDPIVAAHVADGLKYRTWLGKGNAPGLRGRGGPAGP